MKEIYEKYKTQIDNAVNDRCVTNLDYADLIAILRAVEKKLGKDVPLQPSCPVCVLDLITLFYNIMDKELKSEVKASRLVRKVVEPTESVVEPSKLEFDEQG